MHALLLEFRNAGWSAWLVLLVGMAALPAVLVAVVLAALRHRAAFWAGVFALFLGATSAGLGATGLVLGRARTDGALSGEGIDPSQKAHIRRVGYEESRSAARIGLVFAALPLLGGALAVVVGATRKKSGAGGEPGGRLGIGLGLCGAAALPVAGAFVGLVRPLPGPPLDANDPTWWLMDAVERVLDPARADGLDGACRELEEQIGATRSSDSGEVLTADASMVPKLPDAARRCVDHRLEAALAQSAASREAALAELRGSKLVLDDAARARIDAAIAAAPPAPALTDDPLAGPRPAGDARTGTQRPQIRTKGPQVSGRLPPEVIQRIVRQQTGRFRLCYEQALRNDPKAAGTVSVRFVIGRDGTVAAVSAESSMEASMKACVARAFRALSFPQPEQGIVTVIYPLAFTPGN